MPRPTSQERRTHLREVFDREARRLGSVTTLHNHAVADAAGLHQTDQSCLDLLDWAEPLTAGQIAAHLGLTSGAVTSLLDRLEAGGWVTRERDPADRRRVLVRISQERGHELWPIYQPFAEEVARYRDSLSDEQLETVVGFLTWANEAMTEATAHARRFRGAADEG